MERIKNPNRIIRILILLTGFLVRIPRLGILLEKEMHAFRQCQTAIVVQNYFRDGWSLFHYEIPVRGKPWEIIFECPIYQSVVYFLMRLFRGENIDFWCRLLSTIIFIACAYVLMVLSEKLCNTKVSVITGIFFVFSPFELYWGSAALIDYNSVLLGLCYILFMTEWIKEFMSLSSKSVSRGKNICLFIASIISGILGYLQKTTTMIPVVLFLMIWILNFWFVQIRDAGTGKFKSNILVYIKSAKRSFFSFGLLCCVPLFVGYAWTKYSDYSKSLNLYTEFVTSRALRDWNFGTLDQLFSLDTWRVFCSRLIPMYGGFVGALILILLCFVFVRKNNLVVFAASFVSILGTLVILTNLYYVHDYYFIGITAFVSMMIGISLNAVAEIKISDKISSLFKVSVLSVLLYCLIFYFNMSYVYEGYLGDKSQIRSGSYIESVTDYDDKILIYGLDWDPTFLYSANRKGFMVRNDEADYALVKDTILENDNYTFFVTSPGLFAADAIKDMNTVYQCQSSIVCYYFILDDEYIDTFLGERQFSHSAETDEFGINVDMNPGLEVLLRRNGNYNDQRITGIISYDDGTWSSFAVYFPAGVEEMYYRFENCDEQHAHLSFFDDEGFSYFDLYTDN